jgi:hypothetical protein
LAERRDRSADAKGSIVRTTPLFRLEDANSQLERTGAPSQAPWRAA